MGWYLMGRRYGRPKRIDLTSTKRSKYPSWKIIHTFATQDDCEAVRDHLAKYARRGELTIFPNYVPVRDTALSLAQEADRDCIETDDPRLKGS